jgi:uncharacterized membrane protein (DUF485 family)
VTTLDQLARRRLRIAGVLTAVMILAYFGFIVLVAFAKSFVGETLGDDVTIGIVIGASVIVLAPVLTGVYVRWANRHYDAAARALREKP